MDQRGNNSFLSQSLWNRLGRAPVPERTVLPPALRRAPREAPSAQQRSTELNRSTTATTTSPPALYVLPDDQASSFAQNYPDSTIGRKFLAMKKRQSEIASYRSPSDETISPRAQVPSSAHGAAAAAAADGPGEKRLQLELSPSCLETSLHNIKADDESRRSKRSTLVRLMSMSSAEISAIGAESVIELVKSDRVSSIDTAISRAISEPSMSPTNASQAAQSPSAVATKTQEEIDDELRAATTGDRPVTAHACECINQILEDLARIDVGQPSVPVKQFKKVRTRATNSGRLALALISNVIERKLSDTASQIAELERNLVAGHIEVMRKADDLRALQASMRQYGIVPTFRGVAAPSGAVTLVVCDIVNSAVGWSKAPKAMRAALSSFQTKAIQLLKEKHGYESGNVGDALCIAFQSPREAIDWGLCLHAELLNLRWPDPLMLLPEFEPDSRLQWRGLCARIGIHTGTVRTEIDTTTQRTLFLGTALTAASAVSTYAAPGTIAVSSEFMDALGPVPLDKLATRNGAVGKPITETLLPGERATSRITQIVPATLSQRLRDDDPLAGMYPESRTCMWHPGNICDEEPFLRMYNGTLRRLQQRISGVDELLSVRPVVSADGSDPQVSKETMRRRSAGGAFTLVAIKFHNSGQWIGLSPSLLLAVVEQYRGVLRAALKATNGFECHAHADAFLAAFPNRAEALTWSVQIQTKMMEERWAVPPDDTELLSAMYDGGALLFYGPRLRCGVHYGELHYTTASQDTEGGSASENFPCGIDVDRCAALCEMSVEGEVLCSESVLSEMVKAIVEQSSASIFSLGRRTLRSPQFDEAVYQLFPTSLVKRHTRHKSMQRSAITADGTSYRSLSGLAIQLVGMRTNHVAQLTELEKQYSALCTEAPAATDIPPPPGSEAIFIITYVPLSLSLWSSASCAVTEGLRNFVRIVRILLLEAGGYEVRTSLDCFLVCFSSVKSAMHFAIQLQERLNVASWPAALTANEEAQRVVAAGDILVWNGLRACIAIVKEAARADVDQVTGRTMYFGSAVQRCVHVCAAARPGETLVDFHTYQSALTLLSSFPGITTSLAGHRFFHGDSQPSALYTLRSYALRGREFGQLPDVTSSIAEWISLHLSGTEEQIGYVMMESAQPVAVAPSAAAAAASVVSPVAKKLEKDISRQFSDRTPQQVDIVLNMPTPQMPSLPVPLCDSISRLVDFCAGAITDDKFPYEVRTSLYELLNDVVVNDVGQRQSITALTPATLPKPEPEDAAAPSLDDTRNSQTQARRGSIKKLGSVSRRRGSIRTPRSPALEVPAGAPPLLQFHRLLRRILEAEHQHVAGTFQNPSQHTENDFAKSFVKICRDCGFTDDLFGGGETSKSQADPVHCFARYALAALDTETAEESNKSRAGSLESSFVGLLARFHRGVSKELRGALWKKDGGRTPERSPASQSLHVRSRSPSLYGRRGSMKPSRSEDSKLGSGLASAGSVRRLKSADQRHAHAVTFTKAKPVDEHPHLELPEESSLIHEQARRVDSSSDEEAAATPRAENDAEAFSNFLAFAEPQPASDDRPTE